MAFPVSLIEAFWEMDRKMDQKRLAGQTYPTDLEEIVDLEYLPTGHKYHKLDVYYPKGTAKNAKLPVIVDIHGGGWFYGDKELNKNYCLHLAQKGFVVFNISYRLCPEVTMADQLSDCMSALCFISKHLRDYPCDKNRIYVTGDSAGGQLAAFVAGANVSDKIRKAFDVPETGLKIKAIGLVSPVPYLEPHGAMRFYLPYVLGKKYKKQDWAKYINLDKILRVTKKDYPPTILFTSLTDVIASSATKKAYKELKDRGIKTKYNFVLSPKLGHVYQVLQPDDKTSQKAINEMIKFFQKSK